MQYNQWKIIRDQLPAKSPFELKDNSSIPKTEFEEDVLYEWLLGFRLNPLTSICLYMNNNRCSDLVEFVFAFAGVMHCHWCRHPLRPRMQPNWWRYVHLYKEPSKWETTICLYTYLNVLLLNRTLLWPRLELKVGMEFAQALNTELVLNTHYVFVGRRGCYNGRDLCCE